MKFSLQTLLGVALCLLPETQAQSEENARIMAELGPLLSKGAAISLPSSAAWEELMIRAAGPRIAPNFAASVEVTTEADVQNTIKYANKYGVPFLAVSGTHGWLASLNKIQSGIQINMRRMNTTKVNAGGKVATVGGGTKQYQITESLFKEGKQAVTGICECVSAIGPLLGGGHGFLQGRHGFAADNLVSARVVLANGTAVTASATENSDLFWGLRGAGQNFGIVPTFEVKVYDVPADLWTLRTLIFKQDKLEKMLETWNELEVKFNDPGLIALYGIIIRDDAADPVHPVIVLQIYMEGKKPVFEEYIKAFSAVGPIVDTVAADLPYEKIYDAGGLDVAGLVCRHNMNIHGFPNSVTKFDPAAMRKGFMLFSELTADKTFAPSSWLLESFGRRGVEAVPESANAVAPEERQNHILHSPVIWWTGSDAADRQKAKEYGAKIQVAARGKAAPHSYLNYALGDEKLVEVYGREPGRVAKLQKLKKTWDPQNKFGFYMPLQ